MELAAHPVLTLEEIEELVCLTIKILENHWTLAQKIDPVLKEIIITEMNSVRDECVDLIESNIPGVQDKSKLKARHLLKYVFSYHRLVTCILPLI